MRLLPAGHADGSHRAPGPPGARFRGRHRTGDGQPYLPLRHVSAHPPGAPASRPGAGSGDAHGDENERRWPMSVSRRAFLASAASGGAALVIGFRLFGRVDAEPSAASAAAAANPNPFDTWLRLDTDGR